MKYSLGQLEGILATSGDRLLKQNLARQRLLVVDNGPARPIIHVHLHKPRPTHDRIPVAVRPTPARQLIPTQIGVVATIDKVAENGQVHVLGDTCRRHRTLNQLLVGHQVVDKGAKAELTFGPVPLVHFVFGDQGQALLQCQMGLLLVVVKKGNEGIGIHQVL